MARQKSHLLSSLLKVALAGVVVVSIAFALVHHLLQTRTNRSRLRTGLTFETVGLMLQNYSDTFGSLPPPIARDASGKPLHSWRLTVLPLDENPAFLTDTAGLVDWPIGEPWNAPDNAWCRARNTAYSYDGPANAEASSTNIVAITGPGTAFGDGNGVAPKSIAELPYDAILCVEARATNIHWMEPRDFDIRKLPNTINGAAGISSRYQAGFHVLFADGHVWFVSHSVPFESLAKFFSVDHAEKHDRQQVLGPYRI